jgi:hypothetical protein
MNEKRRDVSKKVVPKEKTAFAPDDFYRAYGIAMLNWQYVETALFRLYYMFLQPSELNTVAASYYSLDSFGMKLRLVDATAKTVFNEERLNQWKRIKEDIKSASDERNVLAHLPAKIEEQSGSYCLVLKPEVFVPSSLRRSKKRKYDTNGFEELANKFYELSEQIDKFAMQDAASVMIMFGNHEQ